MFERVDSTVSDQYSIHKTIWYLSFAHAVVHCTDTSFPVFLLSRHDSATVCLLNNGCILLGVLNLHNLAHVQTSILIWTTHCRTVLWSMHGSNSTAFPNRSAAFRVGQSIKHVFPRVPQSILSRPSCLPFPDFFGLNEYDQKS